MNRWGIGIVGLAAAGTVVLVMLVAIILAPPAALAFAQGGGSADCQPVAICVNPGGSVVANSALAIAAHLTLCRLPDDPPGYTWDKCYDKGIPAAALAYWRSVCPRGSGCWPYWQSGDLQCVELVTAAYALAGDPLPLAGNAIDFWALYGTLPGWREIPIAPGWGALGGRRELPAVGDMIVWYNADAPHLGHIAIAVGVTAPSGEENGTLTFAQANGPAPVATVAIAPNASIASPPRFFVVGYIRHIADAHPQ